ncbi:MAG: DegV family protein, partial [Clostridia bacterium]|nr:DegV family protein [Clostridia bacterium]
MRVAITLDSTCDLSEEIKAKYGFFTTPFAVTLGDDTFEDGKIDTLQIFEYVNQTGILPKTSAINEETFFEFFTEIKKNYDAIIHFDISADISSACQNAVNAAKRVENVYVIDSRSLSTGISLLAIYAKELLDSGVDVEEVVRLTREKTAKVQASFVIERLDYLYKGGRCSALALFGANLLKLR